MFVNELHDRRRTTIAELRFYEPRETHDDARNRFEGETVHPEGAYGHPPPSDAVRTRANDYHRGKPRADRRFTMDFTLSRRDTITCEIPAFAQRNDGGPAALASENVVWRAAACPLHAAP